MHIERFLVRGKGSRIKLVKLLNYGVFFQANICKSKIFIFVIVESSVQDYPVGFLKLYELNFCCSMSKYAIGGSTLPVKTQIKIDNL